MDDDELQDNAPPKHLSAEMQQFWTGLCERWTFDARHLKLLRLACEAYDLGQAARETLADSGLTFTDRFGQQKSHPNVQTVRSASITFARLLRAIDLEDGTLQPRMHGIKGRRDG